MSKAPDIVEKLRVRCVGTPDSNTALIFLLNDAAAEINRLRAATASSAAEVEVLRREVDAGRLLLHESGHFRNVNHVLAASPSTARSAYRSARTATDASGVMGNTATKGAEHGE